MFPKVKVLGIISKGDSILVEEQVGKHSKGEGLFYRPIGGTIELGEKSDEALVREFQEELGTKIVIQSYMSCIENIFRINDKIGHEIIQLYLVEFIDKKFYENEVFKVTEGEKITIAKWIPTNDFIKGRKIVYPDGLVKVLTAKY